MSDKFYKDLEKAINKEKRDGYGGICFQLEPYSEFRDKDQIQSMIDTLKTRYKKVEYQWDGYNPFGAFVGKLLVVEWE